MSQPNRQPDPAEPEPAELGPAEPAEPAESRASGPVAASGARPGLYVVDTTAVDNSGVDTTTATTTATTTGGAVVDTAVVDTAVVDTAAAESSDEEPDDPAEQVAPVLEPLIPWDQRVLDTVERVLQARPGWTTTPPSYAQTWAYSRHGDWTTGEGGLLRAAHTLLVLAAVAVLFPLDWVLNVVRGKPIGLVLVTAVVVLLALAY